MKRILSVLCLLASLPYTSLCAEEFPPELTRFKPSSGNPVFTAAGNNDWDAQIRERGWILREGDSWKMWYTGYDGVKSHIKLLGLATSDDGIHWKRHPKNPLIDDLWIEDMMVVKRNKTYYMFAEGERDRAHLLTSTDGVNWKPMGPLDVRKTDCTPIDEGPYGTPTAYYDKGTWYLFYERRDAGIWLATSTDMKVWTNLQDEPVLSPGPQEFDRDLIAMNQVFRHGGRYYASIHGASNERNPKLWASGLAVSDDLVHWKKFSGNPLRPISENKSSGIFVPDGDGFLFYTMHDKVDLHRPE